MKRKRTQATALTEKFQNAKCENCIHFWWKDKEKGTAQCTHTDMNNKVKKIKYFDVCDYFED